MFCANVVNDMILEYASDLWLDFPCKFCFPLPAKYTIFKKQRSVTTNQNYNVKANIYLYAFFEAKAKS